MERSRNETKGKVPIIGVRVLCRESYVFLTGEMSTGTIGNCYGAPTRRYAISRAVGYKFSKIFSTYEYDNTCVHWVVRNDYLLRATKKLIGND